MKISQGFSASIAGVLYAEDFDEPLVEHAPVLAPPAAPEPETGRPSFSLEELKSAVEGAHEEGRCVEREVLMASLEAKRLAALTILADGMRGAGQEAARVTEETLEALAATVLSALAAALPDLCARHAAAEHGLLLRRVLQPLRQTPELQIRIHPSMRTAIEQAVTAALEDCGAKVTWTCSETLLPGDISIRWSTGEAVRDTRSLCDEIRSTLLTLFPHQPSSSVEMSDVQ